MNQSELLRQGYCIVPSVLSSSEVRETRAVLRSLFEQLGSPRFLRFAQLENVLALMRMPFAAPIVARLREALGTDYFTVPDFCAQHDMYGVWHADSDPDGPRAELQRPDFAVVKCGIFLQDNTAAGGGLEVVPAAHRLPLPSAPPSISYQLKRLRDRGLRLARRKRLALRAGDALIFDYRLPPVSARPMRGSDAAEKFVLYFNATGARSSVHYLQHIKRRALREERTGGEVFWSDSLWRRYPKDFPAEFVRAAEQVQARVLVPSAEEAIRWRVWYEAVLQN